MKKIISVFLLFSIFVSTFGLTSSPTVFASTAHPSPQMKIPIIESFPKIPAPFNMLDWKQKALDYDSLVTDWDTSNKDFPLILDDTTHYNMNSNTFKMPAYYGWDSSDPSHTFDSSWFDGSQDALTCMGMVLSGSLLGIDKSNQGGRNYVDMLQTFFIKQFGTTNYGLCETNPGAHSGGSDDLSCWTTFWYMLVPNVLYYQIGNMYPNATNMQSNQRSIADNLYNMVIALGGSNADFYHQGFRFDTMQAYDSVWKEPDAAGMVALIEYYAYKKFGDQKYLDAAKWCLDFLERINYNPIYEMGVDNAVLAAARINADTGSNYNLGKYFNWKTFRTSDSRTDWGMNNSSWYGKDMYGILAGTGFNGYAFAMETWYSMQYYVPTVRYDSRFAKDVGKWMLHMANNSWVFFADQWDSTHQSYPRYIDRPEKVIPYEGFKKDCNNIQLYAAADPSYNRTAWGLGPNTTDLSLYSGSFMGILGSIVAPTNDPKILQLDCLKTDFYRDSAYPTYLYYNPYDVTKSVQVSLSSSSDLYDTVSGDFIATNVSGNVSFNIPADSAKVIVVCPANSTVSYSNNKTMINGVFAGYLTPDPSNYETETDDISSSIVYEGNWNTRTNSSAYGNSDHYSSSSSAASTYTFTGTSIKWIGSKGTNYGKANVYIDGILDTSNIDCYNSTGLHRQTLFSKDNLPYGHHSIKIVPTGTKNSSSSDYNIVIDEFLNKSTSSKIDDIDPSITYSGTWTSRLNSPSFGASDSYSSTANSYAQMTFNGTSVKWIGSKGANYGKADVYIDNNLVTSNIDCYNSTGLYKEVLFSKEDLSSGQHTIKVVAKGTKNSSSSDYNIIIDGFEYSNGVCKVDESSSDPVYSGTWTKRTNSGAYNGYDSYSSGTNNFVQLSFSGTSVKWIGSKGSNFGKADIYIDGVLDVSDLDCYSSTPREQQILYNKTGLVAGKHTIKVVVKGTKNASSSDYNLVFDEFEYEAATSTGWTRVDEGGSGVSYSGTWYSASDSNAFNGAYKYNNTSNNYVQFTFNGTGVKWISCLGGNLGKADVYIDGTLSQSSIDCYSPSVVYQNINFSKTGLTNGQHTIKVVVKGTKNTSSSDYHLISDAFEYQ